MDKAALIRQAWTELEPLLASHGFELVEVELGGLGASPVLRLYIDKPGGIGTEDCTAATRVVNPVLDEHDWIDGRYLLEVSSPGIDRPVRKVVDFARFTGETIRVQTVAPVNGRKKMKGQLDGIEGGEIRLTLEEGEPITVHIDNVKRANLERGL